MKITVSLVALTALAAVASAQSYITTGALTTSDPRFNRPNTATILSGVGTAVAYDVYAFTVTATGTYAAEMSSPGSNLDTYLLVYSSFNPTASLTNLVNGDDDFSGTLSILGITNPGGLRSSKIVAGDTSNLKTGGLALTAGTTYYAVATSYSNATLADGVGSYTLGIGGGPGAVNPVPEPASMAALGLGTAALLRRRRRKA